MHVLVTRGDMVYRKNELHVSCIPDEVAPSGGWRRRGWHYDSVSL